MSENYKNEHLSKDSFLQRVARMYYILEMSQQEISEQLNIGRSSVSRFLSEARERGIIQFQIRSDLDSCRHTSLERQIAELYGLKDCVVFRSDASVHSFGTLASQYLNSVLPTHGAIGLGWGKTLYEIGTRLHQCDPRPAVKIVQMLGGLGAKEELVPAASVIQLWAQALRGKPYLFPAPAIAASPESKDGFMQDPSVQENMKEVRQVDAIVFGIGHTEENSTLVALNLTSGLSGRELYGDSVGDILFHFYDHHGRFSMPWLSERVVGASQEDFMNIELRIGVAHGANKVKAISGALEGSMLHVLITMEETAQQLMEMRGGG